MNNKQMLKVGMIVLLTLVLTVTLASADAMGSGFTYQGQLKSSAVPYTGYCDFEFTLYDAVAEGSQVGSTQALAGIPLQDGYFTVNLDFGPAVFNGEPRFLEIWVRCPAGEGTYQQLTPRQALTAVPYARFAQQAGSALSVPWAGITDMPAGFADGVDNAGWDLAGNVGTDPAINYLGTSDNAALELSVNGQRALRLEPDAISPNLIGGYFGNSVTAGVYGAVIAGGGLNGGINTVTDRYGVVGGGENNQVGNNNTDIMDAQLATVGGGGGNTASGKYSTVGGGGYNLAIGYYSTVGGGYSNTASGATSTVGGGNTNTASHGSSTVGGGVANTASGQYSTVPGGSLNTAAGDYSLAAGRKAKANNPGCFVWGDSTNADIACNNDNRWVVRATGGVYFYTNAALSSGMRLVAGGSSWLGVSNRELKDNFTPVDTQQLLANLAQFPIHTWNYKSQDDSILHIGMMADEFNSLIDGLGGEGEDYINTMDGVGLALAAVQGLYAENQALKADLETLQQAQTELEARLVALEKASKSASNGADVPLTWMMGLGLAAVAGVWVLRRPHGGEG